MPSKNLTAQRLRQLTEYDPNTGIFVWKLSRRGQTKPGTEIGGTYISPDGYRMAKVDSSPQMQHRLAWLYVYGEWPKNQIDHINGIKTDNRICNLRDVSGIENMQNSPKKINNTSGYKGVHFVVSTGRWRAQIRVDGKRFDLGTYDTPEEAGAAYIEGAKKLCTHHPYQGKHLENK